MASSPDDLKMACIKDMKYKRVVVTALGGPENLEVSECVLPSPSTGEARIKILAALVSGPDITTRYGRSPFIPRLPFTPGYAIVGEIEALGPNCHGFQIRDRVAALTAYGGYAEYLLWKADDLIPVPPDLDPGKVVPLILNYIVAYHVMHRWARVKPGDTVLINGASGGIGTAFLQLGKLAQLKMYGVASKRKHAILDTYGAVPIDYHTQDFVAVVRSAEPHGIQAVFEGMAGESFRRSYSLLKKGGRLVGYGNPLSFAGMLQMLGLVALWSILPNGKKASYYSTGVSRLNRRIFLEDWNTLFQWLEAGEIDPILAGRFPILEARKANELLESGQVVGSVVLLAPELL
jgi:NADPH:quinone reductase-like Zn-dependent oxidoreductase